MIFIEGMSDKRIVFALLLRFVVVSCNYTLKANVPQIIDMKPSETTTLTIDDIPPDTAYIICQAHSQIHQLSLSTEAGFYLNSSATGCDVGVVSIMAHQTNMTWYLKISSSVNSRVMVHATLLTAADPLPGGCNEEFNMENDPNIHLLQASTSATVKFQWANLGYNPKISFPYSCELKTSPASMVYQGYVNFLQSADYSEETYFNTLKEMLLAKDIVKHGTWLRDIQSQKDIKSMLTISSYRRQGVVYAVVVKETKSGKVTQAAYIPVVAYDCDINKDCKTRDISAIIFSTLGLIVGVLLCFFGHRFFKTENFVFGFLIFMVIFYQVFALKTSISLVGILVLTGVMGCVGGLLLLGLWWRLGMPVLNVLFIGLAFGYLFSSTLFYTPFANIKLWDTPFNYGMTFTCGVLILPVVMLCFTRFLNILSCAVVGAYGFILAIDIYIGGGMKYIVMNSLRHGTDVDYVKVIVTGPFTTKEIILTVVWLVLAILGTTFQSIRERKKAPFPPCPRRQSDGYEHLRRLLHNNVGQSANDTEPVIRGGNDTSDRRLFARQFQRGHQNTARGDHSRQIRGDSPRQPLLNENRKTEYGSTNNTVHEDSDEDSRPGLV